MKNKAKDLHNPDGYGGLLTKLYAKIMLFERIISKRTRPFLLFLLHFCFFRIILFKVIFK